MGPACTHVQAQRAGEKGWRFNSLRNVLQVSAEVVSAQPAAVWSRRHLCQRRGPQDRGCVVRELYLWFQLTQSAALGLKSQWKNDPSSVTFVLVLLKISFGKKN